MSTIFRIVWVCLCACLGLQAQNLNRINDLSAFQQPAANWQVVGAVAGSPTDTSLSARPGVGVLLNKPERPGQGGHLITNFEHGDIEVSLDFMIPKNANSGIYLMGRYEVQIFDSYGVEKPKYYDCGSIYQRWDDSRGKGNEGYEGHPALTNAARPPGQWQHLDITFEAPRFDAAGQKTREAYFRKVMLNGKLIQQNVYVSGPTRSSLTDTEAAKGPLMIQGDHGEIALRNIRYRLKN